MDPLVAAAAACIDENALLQPRQMVLLAVSGGADSVAMLSVLRTLARQPDRQYRLTAAHLDHGLRDDAQADAAFVADLTRRWDVPCILERCDTRAEADRRSIGIEEAARDLRYAVLVDAARRAGADRIALAHHADDNAETILLRICRGTHLRGLAGIPVSRRIGETDLHVVRPLLRCRRREIEDYCRHLGVSWRTDPTNTQTIYRRNFVRRALLPTLRAELNPRVDDALLRLAETARQAEAFLADHAAGVLRQVLRSLGPDRALLDAGRLAQHPPLVRRHLLRSVLEDLGVHMKTVDRAMLAQLSDLADRPRGGALALPGGFLARREGRDLVVQAPHRPTVCWQPVDIDLAGETPLPDGRSVLCRTATFDRDDFDAHCRTRPPGVEWIDADRLRGRLSCRPRLPGDSLTPLGSPGRQSVSDFLTNLKLPHRLREQTLCLLDAAGLVYLAPHRIADRVKITEQTVRALRIEIHPPPPGHPSPRTG